MWFLVANDQPKLWGYCFGASRKRQVRSVLKKRFCTKQPESLKHDVLKLALLVDTPGVQVPSSTQISTFASQNLHSSAVNPGLHILENTGFCWVEIPVQSKKIPVQSMEIPFQSMEKFCKILHF